MSILPLTFVLKTLHVRRLSAALLELLLRGGAGPTYHARSTNDSARWALELRDLKRYAYAATSHLL